MGKPRTRFIYERYNPKVKDLAKNSGENIVIFPVVIEPIIFYHQPKDDYSGWCIYGEILKMIEEIEKYYGCECLYIRYDKVVSIKPYEKNN